MKVAVASWLAVLLHVPPGVAAVQSRAATQLPKNSCWV